MRATSASSGPSRARSALGPASSLPAFARPRPGRARRGPRRGPAEADLRHVGGQRRGRLSSARARRRATATPQDPGQHPRGVIGPVAGSLPSQAAIRGAAASGRARPGDGAIAGPRPGTPRRPAPRGPRALGLPRRPSPRSPPRGGLGVSSRRPARPAGPGRSTFQAPTARGAAARIASSRLSAAARPARSPAGTTLRRSAARASTSSTRPPGSGVAPRARGRASSPARRPAQAGDQALDAASCSRGTLPSRKLDQRLDHPGRADRHQREDQPCGRRRSRTGRPGPPAASAARGRGWSARGRSRGTCRPAGPAPEGDLGRRRPGNWARARTASRRTRGCSSTTRAAGAPKGSSSRPSQCGTPGRRRPGRGGRAS